MDILKGVVVAAIISEMGKPAKRETTEERWKRVSAEVDAKDAAERRMHIAIGVAFAVAMVVVAVIRWS